MVDPFADAQAWYNRAQKHIAEYRSLAEHERIWTLHSNRQEDGSFLYSLRFNRHILIRLKPIAGEIANAFFQSLDNIIAVPAKQPGVKRDRDIAWPWAIEKDPDSTLTGAVQPAIDEGLRKLAKKELPQPWLTLIKETFDSSMGLAHIDVVKEVSNSGKHWELVPTKADALAVSWTPKDSSQQICVEIPAGHFDTNDEYVFHEGEEINTPSFQTLIGVKLVAAEKSFHPEPLAAFQYTSRFVETALEEARRLWEETSA